MVVKMLDRTIEISLLFDYYGGLLTDKQKEIVELYYYQDLSLGEIASNIKISRQGVYDHLHRAEEALKSYENKLKLAEKNKKNSQKIDKLSRLIKDSKEINCEIKEKLLKRLQEINKYI